jgi:hypothetical protein
MRVTAATEMWAGDDITAEAGGERRGGGHGSEAPWATAGATRNPTTPPLPSGRPLRNEANARCSRIVVPRQQRDPRRVAEARKLSARISARAVVYPASTMLRSTKNPQTGSAGRSTPTGSGRSHAEGNDRETGTASRAVQGRD